MTEQGYPPRQPDRDRYGRPRTQQQVRRDDWDRDAFAADPGPESEVPPWAIPGGVEPIRSPRRATRTVEPPPDFVPERLEPVEDPPPPRRGRGRTRAAATRRRRSRRRLVNWGSAAVVALVIAGVVIILVQPKAHKPLFINHLQKGEFTQAPDACKVLPRQPAQSVPRRQAVQERADLGWREQERVHVLGGLQADLPGAGHHGSGVPAEPDRAGQRQRYQLRRLHLRPGQAAARQAAQACARAAGDDHADPRTRQQGAAGAAGLPLRLAAPIARRCSCSTTTR